VLTAKVVPTAGTRASTACRIHTATSTSISSTSGLPVYWSDTSAPDCNTSGVFQDSGAFDGITGYTWTTSGNTNTYTGANGSRYFYFDTVVNCCSGTLVTYTFTMKLEVYNSSGVLCDPAQSGCNPVPSPTPSPSSSPSGSPSLPPGWNPPDLESPNNDPGNNEGPVNICPPGTEIAACRTPLPNGSGNIGTGYKADPSGLISLLSEKAPFGYAVQIGDAIGGGLASPGSATPDLCYTADLAWIGVVEFCIPTEPFDYLAEWRWLGVGLIWLAGAIALYRIASAGVGNVE